MNHFQLTLGFLATILVSQTFCFRSTLAVEQAAVEQVAAEQLGGTGEENGAAMIVRGEAIYRSTCASCHGPEGQGSEDYYPDPLTGDATIGELAELISDTMPEEDPDACVAEDALAVASFIHHDFYSEAAQVRRRPPQVALSRLTAEQLRQSLADLYGSFGSSPWKENSHGLQAKYFTGRGWKDENKRIERVDPTIDFDFGHDGPLKKADDAEKDEGDEGSVKADGAEQEDAEEEDPEQDGSEKEDKEEAEGIDPEEFHIFWSGSLKVLKTGRYEIVLRSTCSCTLDFGSRDRTLVNNHVQSEGKEEFRNTLYLVGGRTYPVELEFIQRKRKTEQPPAKVSLSWVPPGGVEEIIPRKNWLATTEPATFALQTKLPPDDRSYGYERGTSVSRSWDDSTTAAAVEFAQAANDELYPSYRRKHKKDADENRGILRSFLYQLVETAFRGPLDDRLRDLYVDRHVDSLEDDASAIKQVILITLKSPRFLYPTLDADRSPSRRVANRLALVLFDSLPTDDRLLKMVEKDQLDAPERIRQAAWEMVGDYRYEAKIRAMIYEWFDLAHVNEITKDRELYPNFDAKLVSDLRKSFDRFIDEVVASDTSDFRQLLQSDWMFTTERMADYYGDAWKAAKSGADGTDQENFGLRRSVSDSNVHVGLLTHPLLMSDLAYHRTTSPIHRGVFMTRHILGRVLRPPNAAFTPLNPDLHPGLSTRQRVELQTGEVSCQVCHVKINALGFAFENFDATGMFRKTENGKAIDAAGNYMTRDGQTAAFVGARELGDFLAGNEDCHRSFVEAAFEHFVKQPIAAYGAQQSDRLTEMFQSSGFNVRQLIVEIAVIVASQPLESNSGADIAEGIESGQKHVGFGDRSSSS